MVKRSGPLFPAIVLCVTPLFLLTLPAPGQKRLPAAITQRGINEMAASVEQARRALIEETGLRRPGEDLSAYLRRLAVTQSGESKTQYMARISGYLTLIAQCAQSTQKGRVRPALRDMSEANQAHWERTNRALQILPVRVQKTRAVWQRVQARYDFTSSAPAPVLFKFDMQLEQTALILIAASDGLRDARP